MKSTKYLWLPKVTAPAIFIGLCIMLATHLCIFLYYTEANKIAKLQINRDIVVQQVMNLIEQIRYTPDALQEKVVKAISIPNITLSMSDVPLWKRHFIQTSSLWQLNQHIRQEEHLINLSLELADHRWLNISAQLMKNSLWPQMILLVLELFIIVVILITLISINRFSAPLKRFKKAAERLGVDANLTPMAVYGPTIVKETTHAMNKMQERIRNLLDERTKMLAALSHDLRTPITRMKLRSQFIEDSEIYEKNLHDLEEMEAMIADTLHFVKQDFQRTEKKRFELCSLLSSVCNSFVDVGKKVVFESKEKKVVLLGRPVALKRAFTNIIENAIKYAGTAEVMLQVKYKKVEVCICDNGPGISESFMEKVFEPFFRGDHSRSRETGGTGLGLTIAHDVIKGHQGSITIQNRNPGLKVLVKLVL